MDNVCRFGGDLARDAEGRLYDRTFRQTVGPDGPDLSAIETLAAVRAAGRGLKTLTDRWAEAEGLSEGRLYLLMRLFKSPGQQRSLGELADALGVSPRNVTGLVDHLERDGLVERVPDPADRRSIFARLTPAGEARIVKLWRQIFSQQAYLLDGFEADELARLRDLCFRLVQKMTGVPVTQEVNS